MRLTADDVKHIAACWHDYYIVSLGIDTDEFGEVADGPDTIMLSIGYAELWIDEVIASGETVATVDSDGDVTWYRGGPLTDEDLEGLSDVWAETFGADAEERAPVYITTSVGDGWLHRDQVVVGEGGDVYATVDEDGTLTRA